MRVVLQETYHTVGSAPLPQGDPLWLFLLQMHDIESVQNYGEAQG